MHCYRGNRQPITASVPAMTYALIFWQRLPARNPSGDYEPYGRDVWTRITQTSLVSGSDFTAHGVCTSDRSKQINGPAAAPSLHRRRLIRDVRWRRMGNWRLKWLPWRSRPSSARDEIDPYLLSPLYPPGASSPCPCMPSPGASVN